MPRRSEGWRAAGWAALAILLLAQVVCLYLLSVSGPPLFVGADKVGHVLIFGLPAALAALLGRLWIVALLVLHAALSEPLQGALTTTRVADPWDFVADLVGIVLGVVVAMAIRRRAA